MKTILSLALLLSLTSCTIEVPTRSGTQVYHTAWLWDCPDSPLCPAWLAR